METERAVNEVLVRYVSVRGLQRNVGARTWTVTRGEQRIASFKVNGLRPMTDLVCRHLYS